MASIFSLLSFGRVATSYIGQVSTRCYLPNDLFGGGVYKQFNSRTAHFTKQDVTNLQFIFPHFTCGASESGPTGIGNNTLFASIEYPAGTFTQITWSGSSSTTLVDGSLSTISDAISVTIPANTQFWIRTYQTSSVGAVVCLNPGQASLGDGFEKSNSGLSNKTMSGTVTAIINNDYTYFPCAILATTTKSSVALIGDSRVLGFLQYYPASGDRGELATSIGPSFGYINLGVNGDKASNFVASHTNRMLLAAYCSHAVLEYGINDFAASRTDAQVRSDLNTILGYLTGKTVFLSTVPPVSTSSDNWATTVNQTVASYNAERTANNDWRRTVPSGFLACFEVADVVESARNSGKWAVDGTASKYTPDGIHESIFAFDAILSSGNVNTSLITR